MAVAAAGTPQVDAIVSWLLLDSLETAIVDAVARALLAGGLEQLRLFAGGWHRVHASSASIHRLEVADHLNGVLSACRFQWDVHDSRSRGYVITSLTRLLGDTCDEVRHGAQALRDVLIADGRRG